MSETELSTARTRSGDDRVWRPASLLAQPDGGAGLLDPLFAATALVVALVLGVAFARTFCPTVYWYDSAEFAAHAVTLTPPHPPGYPLYTTFAHLFAYLGPEPAWGVNLMSAVFGCLSAVLLLVLQRQLGVALPLAAAGSLALGLSPTLWANSSVAEVYTPGLSFTLLSFVLLFESYACAPERRRRWLFAACLVAGLGVGVHMSIATLGLGYLWLALGHGFGPESDPNALTLRQRLTPGGAVRMRTLLTGFAWVVVGLTPFFIMGLSMSWRRWKLKVSGGAFKNFFKEDVLSASMAERAGGVFESELGLALLVLAAVGALILLLRRGVLGQALVLGALGNLWFFFDYKVHDIEVFFVPTFAIAYLAVAMCAQGLLEAIDADGSKRRLVSGLAGLLALAWVGLTLKRAPETAEAVDLSELTEASEYGEMLAKELPENATFVTFNNPEEWKHFAVLLYQQRALGQRKDVKVRSFPKREDVQKMLDEEVPVYVFTPIRRSKTWFKRKREGQLHRVLKVKPAPQKDKAKKSN